ncbi:hypothetical protein PENSPDRAFT_418149 [Peniophora sp. CONT]|nr:hypothetical protein PENSPDRAFT_418149 [Peniophora sp. CONT]
MIKDRGEWVVDEKCKCPYALTLTKTEALKYIRKCEPKLTQDELLTLEFETRPNLKDKDYQPSHQYCVLHINNLVHEKAKALGVTAQMPIPSDPPSSPPPLAGPSNAEQSNTVDPPLAQGSTSPDETRKGEPLP